MSSIMATWKKLRQITKSGIDGRTVPPAQVPEKLSTKCYCPSCGECLVMLKCADPLAVCLACERGHRFFILPEPPNATETATAAALRVPEDSGLSPEAVANFWLSDSGARSVLNEQLAELLRAILEPRSLHQDLCFSFCPICGMSLTDYDQPDIWVRGLRCYTGHTWALRANSLYTLIDDTRIELRSDLSDAVIGMLITGWLQGNPDLDTNLHASVRRVLASFAGLVEDESFTPD